MNFSINELMELRILLLFEAKESLKMARSGSLSKEVRKVDKYYFLTYYGMYKKISKELGL